MNLKLHIKNNLIWQGLYYVSLVIINIALARFLEAKFVGELFYFTTILGFMVLLLNFGLNSSFTYYTANNGISSYKLFNFSLIWVIIIAAIVYLSSFFLWNSIPIDNINLNSKSAFAFYYIIGLILVTNQISFFYGKNEFVIPNITLLIANAILLVLIVINYCNNKNTNHLLFDYFTFQLLQGILLAIFFGFKYLKSYEFQLPNKLEIKQLFTFGGINLFANLVFYIVYKLDIIFVQKWCVVAEDLGNYTQANKLSQLLLVIPQIIASTIFPATASNSNNNEVLTLIKKYIKVFAVICTVFTITLLFVGKQIITTIFGDSFYSTHLIIAILMPGIFCLMASNLFSAYLAGKKQHKHNLFAALIAVGTMLLLTLCFKKQYSIFIAAAISSIAYFFEALYCYLKFCKLEKTTIFRN